MLHTLNSPLTRIKTFLRASKVKSFQLRRLDVVKMSKKFNHFLTSFTALKRHNQKLLTLDALRKVFIRVRALFKVCNMFSSLRAFQRYQNNHSRVARKKPAYIFQKTAPSLTFCILLLYIILSVFPLNGGNFFSGIFYGENFAVIVDGRKFSRNSIWSFKKGKLNALCKIYS